MAGTDIQVRVNPASLSRFQFALNEFRLAAGISMRDGFLREAGYCCYEFMRYTPPMPKSGGQGLSKNAKLAGEGAVTADIVSTFVPNNDPSTAFAYMVRAVRDGNKDMFRHYHAIAKSDNKAYQEGNAYRRRGFYARGIYLEILLDENVDRAFQKFKNRFYGSSAIAPQETQDVKGVHRAELRKYHGNILKNGGPSQRYSADQMVITRFIQARQKMVGYVKAGWANTLFNLPPEKQQDGVQYASRNKIPVWVKRHTSNGQGFHRFTGDQATGNFNLTIGNNVGDNDSVASKARTLDYVLQVRANKLDKEVMRRLGKFIRAFNAQN